MYKSRAIFWDWFLGFKRSTYTRVNTVISNPYSETFTEYESHNGFEKRVMFSQYNQVFLTAETDVS